MSVDEDIMGGLYPYEVGAIADEIDAEHKRLTDKAHAEGERSAMKQVRSRSVDYRKGYEQAMADVDERTKTEQNGVGITDELRKEARGFGRYVYTTPQADCLTSIANRIDEQVSKMYANLTIGMEPMAEENMARYGWVKLPVDADGVPIHIGDELTNGKDMPAKVRSMMLIEEGWMVSSQPRPGLTVAPEILRHHHAPTVEDVLREFGEGWYERMKGPEVFDIADYVERYAAKLRLAGETE